MLCHCQKPYWSRAYVNRYQSYASKKCAAFCRGTRTEGGEEGEEITSGRFRHDKLRPPHHSRVLVLTGLTPNLRTQHRPVATTPNSHIESERPQRLAPQYCSLTREGVGNVYVLQ